jgi:hypothetical protein
MNQKMQITNFLFCISLFLYFFEETAKIMDIIALVDLWGWLGCCGTARFFIEKM